MVLSQAQLAAEAASSPWRDVIVGGIQVLGGGTIVGIIAALSNRKKLSADATKTITEAAASTVSDIRQDNRDIREENKELRERFEALEKVVDQMRRDERKRDDLLQEHAAVDHIYVERVNLLTEYYGETLPHLEPLPDFPPLILRKEAAA